ncbi:rRNA pseudouridine synthase [Candidatus Saccharibacteria bacterium]|nr:rRNA pseudouridine synthase [Candidatus Saccharibacteria bacterium]
MVENEKIRLNKFLAERLGFSRREADNLIAAGKVKVNEKPAVLGARIDKNDKVWYNGNIIPFAAVYFYLAMNKPIGYVCSRKRQDETPTIYELLPEKYQSLKTVGRLDKDSSGLILLTNDGDFAFQMTHPKFAKHKVYEVELNRDLEPLHQQMISDFGVELPDGKSQLTLTRLSDGDRKNWRVEMSEGRNRQIRRTFTALGYTVTKLMRKQFGPYALDDLKPGEFRELKTTPDKG